MTEDFKIESSDEELHNESPIENVQLDPDHATDQSPVFNTHKYFSHVLHNDITTDLSIQKKHAEDLSHNLFSLLQPCNDIDILETVQEHLHSAIAVIKAKNHMLQSSDNDKENFSPITTPAPNSNHQKQLCFFSTKKKRRTSERWGKLTEKEEYKAMHK